MKIIMAAIFLAMFAVIPAEAQHRGAGHYSRHAPAFHPQFGGGAHFVARAGNGSNHRFHYGHGGVVIFDPLDYSTDGDFDDDYTGYQPLNVAPNTAILPYATPTSDPDIVISPYAPNAAIDVTDIPQGAEVQDPVTNLIFLNP
jgi:hypothetical protein